MNDDIIEWKTLEFEEHERSADWFWILGIVVVVGAIISIVVGNTLFAILIILGGFIIGVYATKHPDTLSCRIDNRGVHVNNETYMYKSIDTFWIDEKKENRVKLLMTLTNKIALQVVIPLEDTDLDEVHQYLSRHVEEDEQDETLTEQVMEWLKI